MFYVYALCDPRRDDQVFYIGKGSGDRCYSHLKETYHTTLNRRKWCKIAAIKKAGLEVVIKLIESNLESQQAYELEAKLIKQYGRIGFEENGILTNICEDNRPPSAKGRTVSEETRKLHSERQKGPLNHRYGKEWSEEQKEFRRQFNLENGIKPPVRNKPHSEATKAKMSAAAKGKKKSPEHCRAIGEARRGKELGPCSAEKAKRIAESQYRNYQLTNPEGRVFTVNTGKLKEMIKVFGWSYGGIMAAKVSGRKYRGWSIVDLGRMK